MSKKTQLHSTHLLQSIEFARVSAGRCIYAIGDIHGMGDLFARLLDKVRLDFMHHGLSSDVVILGDMVDRGPASRSVMEIIISEKRQASQNLRLRALKGNHEAMLLSFLESPEQHGAFWLRNGGTETLQSYGVYPPEKIGRRQWVYVRDEFLERLPSDHLAGYQQLPSKFTIDDYFFCHASIKEGQALGEQRDEDLLWSRQFPNEHWGPQEKIIVHGHQPVAEPLIEKFHINVDTGAFATGTLTCVKLCGAERSFMTASSDNAQ